VQDASRAIELNPRNGDVYSLRAAARLDSEDYENAEKDYSTAIDLGADGPTIFHWRGVARRVLGRFSDAESDLSRALEQDPAPFHHLERGRIRFLQGRARSAEEDLSAALADAPLDPNLLHIRGLARYADNDFEGAVEDCQRALETGEPSQAIFETLVAALVHLGRLDEAHDACVRCSELGEQSHEALGSWGLVELGRGALERSFERFQAAVAGSQEGHASLGLLALLTGRWELAERSYEEAVASSIPLDALLALDALEFWSKRHPDRLTSVEAQEVSRRVRDRLRPLLPSADARADRSYATMSNSTPTI
jgi:tetratricopeptide (TPR) repeat protein